MRIAFAMINCNRRDGSARAVNEVAERLADRGHDVDLYARKAEDIDLSKVRWRKVSGPGWPEVVDFSTYHWKVNHLLKKNRYDIVHSIGCNTLRANVVTIQNIQSAKRKILSRIGRDEKIGIPRRLTRWLYLEVTTYAERKLYSGALGRRLMFLPVSRGVAAELRASYDIGAAMIRIVPNAADTAMFRPITSEAREAWRFSNGLSKEDVVCIFSGGEWARKGLDRAIRALAMMHHPGIKLFVAGDDPDCGRFKRLAVDLGLGKRVIFGGFRQDIQTALAASDLLLFPSHYEAFSLATIEAAACGLPVVATKINGTEDFIAPGVNGEFIENDPVQIAHVVDRLCRNPIALREMGAEARKLVERNYTWDRVASMAEEAYAEYCDPLCP